MKLNSSPSIIELFKNYAFPLWKALIMLLVLSLIATILTTLQPLLVSGLLEVIIGNNAVIENQKEINNSELRSFFDLNNIGAKVNYFFQSKFNSGGSNLILVIVVLTCFMVIALMASIFNYASLVTTSWIKVESTRLIRSDIVRHLLSLNLSFFHNQKSGEIVSRFIQDATNTATGIGPMLYSFVYHGILIALYSFYLFSTDFLLTIAALTIILFQWVITKLLKRPVRIREKNNFDMTAKLVNTMHEALTSIRIIKSFGADKFENKKFNRDINSSKDAEFSLGIVRAIEPQARTFLDNFAIAGIFIVGFIQVQNNNLTIQGFILFLFVGRLLIAPINKFSVVFVWMQALLASYDRLFEIFKIKNDVIDGENIIKAFKDNIIFKDVCFSYDANQVLSNISFEIKKGEVIAIVGPSGAGKSTLTDLLLRLYDPSSGSVSMDGSNLKTLKGIEYRRMFGAVSQESLLFNDSILNNICYGRNNVDLKQIKEVAKIANAHEFITNLPDGYNTIVGDRGVKLSGGQRQRISIARAIYSNPEIVIFDEATSSLDSESEKKVRIATDNILSNYTSIVIAHRLSTIKHADKIIVIDKGVIESIGKHEDLLKDSEVYFNLYNLQHQVT